MKFKKIQSILSIALVSILFITGCSTTKTETEVVEPVAPIEQTEGAKETEYPITVMLKDNSTEEYVYNDTQTPKENSILLDAVHKDGKYELMVDFNEIEVFNFNVFIVF